MKRLVVALLLSSLVLASAQSERPELEVKIETDPLRNNVDIYVDCETILMDKEESLEEKIYIVKKGDTLIKIARRFGTTVYRLQEDNDLEDAGSLEVGDSLIIRRNKAEKEDTRLEDELEEQIYVVKKGDTLFKIAKMFGVTVRELQEMNGLKDVKKLKIGDSLIIRGDKAVPEETILGDKRGNLEERIYIVKRGDTLFKIAERFGTTVERIQKDNDLKNTKKLEIGDSLIIRGDKAVPKETILGDKRGNLEEKIYIVKRGDTLFKIAERFGTTVERIRKDNDLKNTKKLEIGDSLIIRGDKAVPEETILGDKRGNLEERIYIVKRGDTLYSLAKKFKTTVDKIQDDNRLHDARKLEIGDNLIIREHGIERKRESLKLEKEERKYIVERGDTLLKIVKKLGMTVYELQQRGIVENTDDIKVGDILIIK